MSPGSVTERLHFFLGEYDAGSQVSNVAAMEACALPPYGRGHVPVLGEWLALPALQAASSHAIGDAVYDAIFHPHPGRDPARGARDSGLNCCAAAGNREPVRTCRGDPCYTAFSREGHQALTTSRTRPQRDVCNVASDQPAGIVIRDTLVDLHEGGTMQIAWASRAPHLADSMGWSSDTSIGNTLKRSPQQAGFFFCHRAGRRPAAVPDRSRRRQLSARSRPIHSYSDPVVSSTGILQHRRGAIIILRQLAAPIY